MALSDLTTKGFCVVKNLFNNKQLETIRSDFDLIKDFPVNKDYPVLPVGKKIQLDDIFSEVIDPLCKLINKETRINTNFRPTPVYFSIEHGVNFNWHQDHESFFQTANHLDYLNIYIPIHKPVINLSNVCVIDFEKLLELDSSLKFLKGYGATRFTCTNTNTIINDDNNDTEITIDFNIDDIADCPNLEAGDALIMRGDCIHRTQDTLTDRVSMSIRMMNTETVIKRSNFNFTSKGKEFVFKSNMESYNKLMSKFGNREEMKLGELHNVHTNR